MKIHISDMTNSLLVSCSDNKYVTEERTPSVNLRVILQQRINIGLHTAVLVRAWMTPRTAAIGPQFSGDIFSRHCRRS